MGHVVSVTITNQSFFNSTTIIFSLRMWVSSKIAWALCGLRFLALPGAVIKVGESAFASCECLIEADFRPSVQVIDRASLSSCDRLEVVNLEHLFQ
jgi:hypothetical protein